MNVIFISSIGILLIACKDLDSKDIGGSKQESSNCWYLILRAMLLYIIPSIRLTILCYILIWLLIKIRMEFKSWQEKNQKVEIQPYVPAPIRSTSMDSANDNHRQQFDGLLNSFVRVSGFRNADKYLKQINLKHFQHRNQNHQESSSV